MRLPEVHTGLPFTKRSNTLSSPVTHCYIYRMKEDYECFTSTVLLLSVTLWVICYL
uniref:Putative head-to-tail joining protein n=1 Tax=uncultured marine virus TaxID=186617 RepID=A0A0F7L8G2_9VIRU|nr:putative head-to-tail joining protein [uncultured marine virus]